MSHRAKATTEMDEDLPFHIYTTLSFGILIAAAIVCLVKRKSAPCTAWLLLAAIALRMIKSGIEAAASYASAIWHGRGAHDSAVRLVAITISRRAASSPLALQRTLRRRRALLAATPEPEQTALPWDEDDSGDDEMAARMLSRPGLENGLDERSRIERLSRRNGWFVPASTLLDYLLERRPDPVLTATQRRELERRWLAHKIRFGTA